MKQVLQNLKTGETDIAHVPAPKARKGHIVVRTTCSLISSGTERMLVDFGKAGLLQKARQQPDKVKAAIDKIRTDGFAPTIDAIRNKLDQPLPMGYCNVGTVVEIGPDVTNYAIGDRVVSNAPHAEFASVSINLCAKIPDKVDDESAAFTFIGAIALQGIRLVEPTFGEAVVVSGLGLIGLLTVQLLRANGCRVLGIDSDPAKLEAGRRFGAEAVSLSQGTAPVDAAEQFSRGRGVDAVIITASTSSSEPVHQAALMCRKRGRIVLVGVTGLELSRADFYEKEISFQVSCSYGPGRYDPQYEDKGVDYPFGYVRWTEQRNCEAVLDAMSRDGLELLPLISHRFHIDNAANAYELISNRQPSLGIILTYDRDGADVIKTPARSVRSSSAAHGLTHKSASIGFIGAGNYALATLMPAFRAAGAKLISVASAKGVSGYHAAQKFGFEYSTTDTEALLSNANISSVVISTRHDSHASLVDLALRAGKHAFVEKPLCLTISELDSLLETIGELGDRAPMLMVGFNRRFAPQIIEIVRLLRTVSGPKSFVMTVNAGDIPKIHWTQDPAVGGGRIVGEACHFIDLLRHLAGSPIASHHVKTMTSPTNDTAIITLQFEDGSIGAINYFANGCKTLPKERLEIFAQGRVLALDNFRVLYGHNWPNFKKSKMWRQDKGQSGCAAAFVNAVLNGGPCPIPLNEIEEVARKTIEIATNNNS